MIIAFFVFCVIVGFALAPIVVIWALKRQERIMQEIKRRVDESIKNPPENPVALKRELLELAGKVGLLNEAQARSYIDLIPDRKGEEKAAE